VGDELVLLLEPSAEARAVCLSALAALDIAVREVSTPEAMFDLLEQITHPLLLLDLGSLTLTGLSEVRGRHAEADVVVTAEHGTISEATEAMRRGALDYLPKPFSAEDVSLAVRRWRQHQELRGEKEHLSEIIYLLELGRTLTSTLDLQELYDQIILQVARAFVPDTVSLMLLDESQKRLIMVAQRGLSPRAVLGTEVSLENSIAGQVVREGRPLLLLGGLEGTPYESLARGGLIGSAMSVPLRVQRRIIGVLNVNRRRGRAAYTDRDAQLVHVFASQIAIALQNAQLYESLRQERDKILKAQEDVRRELARDLHDGLTQLLAALVVTIDHTRSMVEKRRVDLDGVQEELEYLRHMARDAVRDARALIFGLRPLVLETKGLIAALEQYLDQLRENDPRTVYHLQVSNFDRRTPLQPSIARVLFAILQEAINNARKHARAGNIWVIVRHNEEDESLEAEVRDDGVGFDLDRVEATYDQRYSFGLLNMRERATLINGIMRLESEPGAGTQLYLRIPWHEAVHQSSEGGRPERVRGE
jgi:signal transduction histidine kinase/ActR/RegA family two-component response regulator